MSKNVIVMLCITAALAVVLAVLVVRARRSRSHVVTERVVQEAVQNRAREREAVEHKPPEIERLAALIDGYRADTMLWDAIIAVGDVYRKGAFPRFLPNPGVALECFKVAARCSDGKIAGMGQERYIEVHTDAIPAVDQAGGELPTEYGERICELALAAIGALPYSAFATPRHTKIPSRRTYRHSPLPPPRGPSPRSISTTRITCTTTDHEAQTCTTTDPKRIILKCYSQNDPFRSRLHALGPRCQGLCMVVGDKWYCDDGDALDTQEAALHLIDNLNDTVHGTFGRTERDVLYAAWETIQRQDGVLRDNLVETLAMQLASGIDHGVPVCSTGKITRIMSTFDGVEDIAGVEKVKPMWALRDELAGLAAKSRNAHDDAEDAKREFAEQARLEYVVLLGMSRGIIDQIVDEYSLGFT